MNVNPGSGNPIGGLTVAIHTHGRTVDEMVLRSPSGLKSALGENPKRVYGEKKQTPSTRLGTASVIRQAFVEAQNYLAKHDYAEPGKPPPARDLTSEALGLVLAGAIPWRQHCHRADDIATAVRIADEFGYRLVIDHGTEAHLIADLLAAKGIPVLIGPLFTSRSKVELRNRSLANPGRLAAAGRRDLDHHRPPGRADQLPGAPGDAVGQGGTGPRRPRCAPSPSTRPGCSGFDGRIGSLAVGKDADLVLWSGDPLDVMQRALRVFIARPRGLPLRRDDPDRQGRRPMTDAEPSAGRSRAGRCRSPVRWSACSNRATEWRCIAGPPSAVTQRISDHLGVDARTATVVSHHWHTWEHVSVHRGWRRTWPPPARRRSGSGCPEQTCGRTTTSRRCCRWTRERGPAAPTISCCPAARMPPRRPCRSA